jgi:hypothetical protein
MKTGRFMGMFGALLLASLNPAAAVEMETPHFRGYALNGYNPVYFPRRGKFKGYMRENKRCSFNKNR